MRLDVERDIQIAGWPATRPGVALPADPNLLAVVDAGRNLDRDTTRLARATLAAALAAGDGDHRALAAALVAGRDGDHVEKRRALANFAYAVAFRAAHRIGARLRAVAAAGRADLIAPILD